ncbi:MAG: hypothetical protein F6J93_16165 [Oscillatoria sp. SIO1A7]|nr:hypothetical protein [Oscillatoria sp. SIO1A7]
MKLHAMTTFIDRSANLLHLHIEMVLYSTTHSGNGQFKYRSWLVTARLVPIA